METKQGMLSIANWEKFQQYKDRNPKWIKLHREILTNYQFDRLTEVQQIHLVKLWLLASKVDNQIPNDPAWIKRQIGAKSAIDIKRLIDSGFLLCTDLYENVQKNTHSVSLSYSLSNSFWKENELEKEYVAFKKMRVSIKAPMNETAETRLVAKLKKLKAEGHDIRESLNKSTDMCWKGVFAPEGENERSRQRGNGTSGTAVRERRIDKDLRILEKRARG